MATSVSSAMDSKAWRTSFLTLRDETHQYNCFTDSSKRIQELLNRLIFSQLSTLTAASPYLPSHEVTSDLLFLLELILNSRWIAADLIPLFSYISKMMYDVCVGQRVALQLNSSSWRLILDSLSHILQLSVKHRIPEPLSPLNLDNFWPVMQCLETIRLLVCSHQQKFTHHDDVQLVDFLLRLIEYSNLQLVDSSTTLNKQKTPLKTATNKHVGFWECHTLAYTILGEVIQRLEPSFPAEMWHRTIGLFRKIMDFLLSRGNSSEDYIMSRFLVALLNCLHLVLVDPKGPVKDHVSSLVATLKLFFVYGRASSSQHKRTKGRNDDELAITIPLSLGKKDVVPYRPPHLRKREKSDVNHMDTSSSLTSFSQESSNYSANDLASSDSDCSDCEWGSKDADSSQFSKVRVCSIICIQDLCQIDPKSFTSQWTALLPCNDVLQSRKLESTLMTCLLFDPYVKVQMASACALTAMLDKSASAYLQMAEYNESPKWGSFMPLSSSLGCMLMQLHTGILYMIQRERHSRLLTSVLKILGLLIIRTPYQRMPKELLPKLVNFILIKIENEYTIKNDLHGHLASLIGCLGTALSITPPSLLVKSMLNEELSTANSSHGRKSTILATLFQYSEHVSNLPTCIEALQGLRSVVHSYPNVANHCWHRIAMLVSNTPSFSIFTNAATRKEHASNGFVEEKALAGVIKVLDECLRAVSGFRGTEDFDDDKLFETPFVTECTRATKVSSAPSFVIENSGNMEGESQDYQLGKDCWSQTVEKLLHPFLQHNSPMVRSASVTCFAGITSPVFAYFSKEKQDFVIRSLLYAAVHDETPSVRSSACRGIGVISCFPQFPWSAEIVAQFFNAIEKNLHDPLVSVRATASWALANLCESMRHNMKLNEAGDTHFYDELSYGLTDAALQLTRDGDKIKSNAVRALGNLSRYVNYHRSYGEQENVSNSNSIHRCNRQHMLDRIVQAFLSCVTSGNVKVQWNVCHALSNLFLNKTISLPYMQWTSSVYSVLLLLLRDSSNFKIKIQAAAALAVPTCISDYGKSFKDIVQVLVHVLENFGSIQISDPSGFKYRVALENQMVSTVLHILAVVSSSDDEALRDFFMKKAIFLEEWLTSLCISLENSEASEKKKTVIVNALVSVEQFYRDKCGHSVANKFEKLTRSLDHLH